MKREGKGGWARAPHVEGPLPHSWLAFKYDGKAQSFHRSPNRVQTKNFTNLGKKNSSVHRDKVTWLIKSRNGAPKGSGWLARVRGLVAESTFCSPFPSYRGGEQGRRGADLRNQRKWGRP